MKVEARLTVGLALAIASCGGNTSSQPPRDGGALDVAADMGPLTPLQSVAAIVIPNCAVAGCHDAVSKTHAMDLSTPEKIISNWVDVRGFDHCTGMDTPRVIPGDPDASLVILKVEGIAVCAQSNRMPLPPRDALTAEQIEVIRDWIAAGAPSDRPPPEDGGADDAVGGDDAGAEDGGDPGGCSATNPCPPELICAGDTCGGRWECISISTRRASTRASPRRSCSAAAMA